MEKETKITIGVSAAIILLLLFMKKKKEKSGGSGGGGGIGGMFPMPAATTPTVIIDNGHVSNPPPNPDPTPLPPPQLEAFSCPSGMVKCAEVDRCYDPKVNYAVDPCGKGLAQESFSGSGKPKSNFF